MALGRISGPLLKADLIRNGINLAFETDLLYLDVVNQRVGIRNGTPQHELDVLGTTQTIDLLVSNRADIGDVNIVGNTISSDGQYLNLGTLDDIVALNKIRIDSIDIEGNLITTNDSNANLELRPNGTGSVDVHSNLNVDGDVYVSGNITADGTINLGDANTDNVVFNAEIASNIIPDLTNTYDLGSDPDLGGKEWRSVYVRNLVASSINSVEIDAGGVDLTFRQGNIWYVSANGDDLKTGDHILDPYGSITQALSVAQSGDTIYISSGVYEESFPLTVPVGVTVTGQGIRSVTVKPTDATKFNDAFLLNGETTVENLTVRGFYNSKTSDVTLDKVLNNPNAYSTSNSDFFGDSVSISGNRCIVGAYGEDDAGGNTSGKAYIFDVTDGSLLRTLNNPNAYGTSGVDQFGSRVAISGDRCIVSAYAEDDAGGDNSGKAYIYDLNKPAVSATITNVEVRGDLGSTTTEYIDLKLSTESTYDRYTGSGDNSIYAPANGDGVWLGGTPTIIDSDGFIIDYSIPTAVNASPPGMPGGLEWQVRLTIDVVYGDASTETKTFEFGGNVAGTGSKYISLTPIQIDNPNAFSTSALDFFGISVDIDGDRCIVGAYNEDDAGGGGTNSGKAYIFDVTTGALVHTLDNPNAYSTSNSDFFGYSVAISGNRCIVGAYAEDDAGGLSSGKAYIFDVTTGALVHTLDNPNAYSTSSSDLFGWSVAISGDRAIVGAHQEDEAGANSSGKAYIFDVITGALIHTLDNPNAFSISGGDFFGFSVDIDGDRAIVGAYGEDDAGGLTSGKAYIFDVLSGNLIDTLDNPNAYDTSANDYFGHSVSISGDRAIVGAYQEDDAGGGNSGKAYTYLLTGEQETGFAFRFAENAKVSTRSPYVKNITVITEGTSVALGTNSADDPRGFNARNAGKGVFVDGSILASDSNEASMLFHSATFITPGVDAVTLTNGARVEWLNSFTYFAKRSIYAYDGPNGLYGSGKTALRVSDLSGTIGAGETIQYYSNDGNLLASGQIASVSDDGKIFIDGKIVGFETAAQRGGKLIVANGDAKLSTSVKKFGTASLALDGTGDYASIAADDDFGLGTGDFTIEGWIYLTDLVGTQQVFDFRAGVFSDVAPTVYVSNGGQIRYYTDSADRITGSTLNSATWYHVGLVRESGDTKLYVNGAQVGSTYTDSNNYGSAKSLTIGSRYDGGNEFGGYIDDFRIVKGVAIAPSAGSILTRALVTPETVLMARFNGDNNSTTFADDVLYDQDIRFSGGATATEITLTDYTDFGAEVRLIGSASVYGDFGLVGDGPGVLMYAIGHNLAYIGNGKEVTNDPETVIQANEVVETNNAKIRYNSVDHKGDFRVGDLFYVNQETGSVSFSVSDFTINTTDGVTFVTGGNTTFIDGTKIETGDWRISGNTIETLTLDAEFNSAGGEINLNADVNITGNLDVTGNVTIGGNITIGDEATDTIQIVAGIDSDILPSQDSVYNLGSPSKRWNNLWINQINVDGIRIEDNFIQTVESNSDLELRASGTGNVLIPNNNVVISNDLTVNGETTLNNATITGELVLNGNLTQDGSISATGDVSVGGDFSVTGSAQFEEILIDDNFITTTSSNTDLELRASGTGKVLIPNNDVEITNELTVNGQLNTTDLTVSGEVTADSLTNGTVLIEDNYIRTVASNANLELRANGTGLIDIPDNDVQIAQDLTVNGTTTLKQTSIVGNITHIGDVSQTGSFTINGSLTNGTILIDNNFISSIESNSDLELRANGTGKILVPDNDVELNKDLIVVGTTFLTDININGTVTHTGDVTQTGSIELSGNYTISGLLDVDSSAQFENISIVGNKISTTQSNSDLELSASGTGNIVVPNNDVVILNDLQVAGSISVGDINSVGTITANRFSTGNILIDDNFITTTITNSDLELRANGTGEIYVPTNDVLLGQDLTVNGQTYLQNTSIVGNITHTGDVSQTGNISLDGNITITGTATIEGAVQYEDIRIEGNVVTTTLSNSDLELRANGTGIVVIPDNDVEIANNLTVNGTLTVGNINSTGTIQANNFTTGDILIDDNFITTTTSNSNLELRANGTGSIIIDDLNVSGSTISSTTDIVIEPGSENVVINGTGSLKLPSGNTLQRPTPIAGQVRFNSELSRFEGFNGTNWIQLNGVVDLDGDTKVTAELTEGANDNIIRFDIAGSTIVDIDANRLNAPKIAVDDITLDGNVISSSLNTDLVLDAQGTGSVVFENFKVKDNVITNTVSNSVTTFNNTGDGYVKFAGTYGLVIPVGTSFNRPPLALAETGQMRLNTELGRVEIFDGANWVSVAGAEAGITRPEAEEIAFGIVLTMG